MGYLLGFRYFTQYYQLFQSILKKYNMNNKNLLGSPDLKIYRSTIKELPKQNLRQIVENIAAKILNSQFNEASKMCFNHNFKQLGKITLRCYEMNLLKWVLNDKFEKEKQNSWLNSDTLSQQLKSTLQIVIKHKQSWSNHKKYYQEIDASIRQLMTQKTYDTKIISGVNEYLQKIKDSLYNLNIFIFNLKKQQSKLKQQKKSWEQEHRKLNRSIISLNRIIERKNQQLKTEKDNMLRKSSQKREQFQVLKRQKNEYERKLGQQLNIKDSLICRYQSQNKQLNQNLNQLKIHTQKVQSQLTLQQQKTQKYLKRIKDHEISAKEWLLQKKKYKNQIKQKNESVNSLINDLQSSNKIVEDLQTQQRENRQIIEQLTAQVRQLDSKCLFLDDQIVQNFVNSQTQTSNFQQQMTELHLQKQQLASQLSIQSRQKHILAAKLQDTQVQLQRVKEQKRYLEQHKLSLDKENDELTQLINHLTEQLKELKQDYHNAESQIQELRLHIPKAVEAKEQGINTLLSLQDLDNIQNRIVKDQQVINNYEKQINVLNQNIIKIQQSKEQVNRRYQQIQSSYINILRDIELSKIQRKDLFFIGKILGEQPQGRQYLQSVIQKVQQKTIRKTVLLYQLDKLNTINIHKYIDNISNIVLLIKTIAGWVVGGYSQGPFYPKMISNKNGLIVSVTGRQFFGLKVHNSRAISYDDFFIIFGNSQIRIKIQEFKLFSNFAINASYYDSREHKVQMITGEKGVREVQVQHIEVFKVQFY